MDLSVFTEQLLAVQDDAKAMLALVKTENRREMVRKWEKAANSIMEKMLCNLEAIENVDVKVYADWLDKYRLLKHFLAIAGMVEQDASQYQVTDREEAEDG